MVRQLFRLRPRTHRFLCAALLGVMLLVGCGGESLSDRLRDGDLAATLTAAPPANAAAAPAIPTPPGATPATSNPAATSRPISFPATAAGRSTATISPSRDRVSEGVRVTGADRWQAAGFTGSGVRVGVIEWTFNETDTYLNGATVTAKSFRADGKTVVTNEAELPYGQLHGTATAEIVHEMAPDAALYLAVITQDPASFVQAIDWLTDTARVQIISFSGGWYSGYGRDGTSPMAQAVDRAKAAGVFVVLSGGNKGSGAVGSESEEGHFRATYADTDGDGYHDFAPPGGGKGINGMTIRVGGGILRLQLDWGGDKNPTAAYRFSLTDTDNMTVATSDLAETSDTHTRYQRLEVQLPRGAYALHIKKETPNTPDLPLDIFFSGAQFPQITPDGSLNIPADARGSVAVGSVNWRTDQVAAYASQGPTRDGRTKPDLYGPDCTASRVYSTFGGDFCGASAATPHVAGAAALVKGAFPDATPDDIFRWLKTYGKPLPNGSVRVELGPLPPHG